MSASAAALPRDDKANPCFAALLTNIALAESKPYQRLQLVVDASLTEAQILELKARLKQAKKIWQSNINLADYIAHTTHERDPEEDNPEARFAKFKREGLTFDLVIDTEIPKAFIQQFILDQIESRIIRVVQFKKPQHQPLIDAIIQACLYSIVQDIFFCEEQDISEPQAQRLLAMLRDHPMRIFNMSGRRLLESTVKEFAAFEVRKGRRVELLHCPMYDTHRKRLYAVKFAADDGFRESKYQPEDIKDLTQVLTDVDRDQLSLSMDLYRGTYQHAEWKTFFPTVFGSRTDVRYLLLSSTVVMSPEVLLAVMQAVGLSRTLKGLELYCRLTEEAGLALAESLQTATGLEVVKVSELKEVKITNTVVVALVPHSALQILSLKGSVIDDDTSTMLARLLQTTRSLRELDIDNGAVTDVFCQRLAVGLASNGTLTDLKMHNNTFTDIGLLALGQSLKTHPCLNWMSFAVDYGRARYTMLGLFQWLACMQSNYSLTRIAHSHPGPRDDEVSYSLEVKEEKLFQRNRQHQKSLRQQENQSYVGMVIALSQAHRQNKKVWNTEEFLLTILEFLKPATLSSRSSAELIQNTVRDHKRNARADVKVLTDEKRSLPTGTLFHASGRSSARKIKPEKFFLQGRLPEEVYKTILRR